MTAAGDHVQEEIPSVSNFVEKKFFQLFEGQDVLVETGRLPEGYPSYYDPIKFRRGQDFVRRNYAGISLAHFISLITLFTSTAILKVLIFTQKSETVMKAFKRYVGTLVHVTAWYCGDVWKSGHPARRSIQLVRDMHSHGQRIANSPKKKSEVHSASIAQCGECLTTDQPMLSSIIEDSKLISSCPYAKQRRTVPKVTSTPAAENEDYVYFNQYDMFETQFAFVGIVILFPHKFGFHYINDDDLRGFIHFWRCIGFLLGIKDEYNLCQDDDLDKTRDLCRAFLDHMVKPSFKNASIEFEHMGKAVAMGSRKYYPGLSFESLYALYAYAVDLPAENFLRAMSYGQYFYYLYLRLVFSILCWIPGVMFCFSALTKFLIGLVVDRANSWWPSSWGPPTVDGLDTYWNLTPELKIAPDCNT